MSNAKTQGFTGTQLGLTYIGNHAYAYSGTVATDGSATTMLDFFTGKEYLIGKLNFSGVWGDMGSSAVTMILNINGEDIVVNKVANTSARDVEGTPIPIVLPPNSRILVTCSQASGSDRNFQATITGRIYG